MLRSNLAIMSFFKFVLRRFFEIVNSKAEGKGEFVVDVMVPLPTQFIMVGGCYQAVDILLQQAFTAGVEMDHDSFVKGYLYDAVLDISASKGSNFNIVATMIFPEECSSLRLWLVALVSTV